MESLEKRVMELERENEELKKRLNASSSVLTKLDVLQIFDSVVEKLQPDDIEIEHVRSAFIRDYFNSEEVSFLSNELGQYVSRYEFTLSGYYRRYYYVDRLLRGEIMFLFNLFKSKYVFDDGISA